MHKISIQAYKDILPQLYEKKISGIAYGGYGIGKTEIEKEVARDIAKKEDKQYVEWNNLTQSQKMRVEREPAKFFVNAILHLGQFDSVDLHGLPKLNGDDYTIWRPIRIIRYFSRKGASGIFFLDEYPQSREDVQKASTQLIRDRQMGDIPLQKDVYIFAAGNREEDNSGAMPLLEHVKDRFIEMEISFSEKYYIGSPNEKTIGYFEDKLFDPLLVFLQYSPGWLYKVDNVKEDKAVTPRGIFERANPLLLANKDDPEKWFDLLSISVGEGFASSFMSWHRLKSKLNITKILDEPESVKDITDVASLYSLILVLYNRYKKDYTLFNKIIAVIGKLNQYNSGAYVMTLLKRMKNLNPNGFRKIMKHPAWKNSLAEIYADYMDI